MDEHVLSLDALFAILPNVPEAEAIRHQVMAASIPNPGMVWTSGSSYSTVDKRVVPTAELNELLREAEQQSIERVRRIYTMVAEAVNALAQDDAARVAERLIGLGEQAAAAERPVEAADYFQSAVRVTASRPEPQLRSLALRRLARARASVGDLDSASALYRASHEQAAAAGDQDSQIVALLGMGNMLTVQGRWQKAGECYQRAMTEAHEARSQLLGQALINLSIIARETGDHAAAAGWLEQARSLWPDLEAADRSVFHNNAGLLHLARREFAQAHSAFEAALQHADSDYDRAMICDNLAELLLQQGRLDQAEAAGRRAEAFALSAGSPRALAEVYVRLGKVFRLRGDANGVTFFEKALEICRERPYALIEAHAFFEYGLFRRLLGDLDEARSFVEQAHARYSDIGSAEHSAHAAQLLAQLGIEADPPLS